MGPGPRGAPALAGALRTPDFAGTSPLGPSGSGGRGAEIRMACCTVAHKWHTERRSVTLRGAVNTLAKSGDHLVCAAWWRYGGPSQPPRIGCGSVEGWPLALAAPVRGAARRGRVVGDARAERSATVARPSHRPSARAGCPASPRLPAHWAGTARRTTTRSSRLRIGRQAPRATSQQPQAAGSPACPRAGAARRAPCRPRRTSSDAGVGLPAPQDLSPSLEIMYVNPTSPSGGTASIALHPRARAHLSMCNTGLDFL
jgi:hypothetical protein